MIGPIFDGDSHHLVIPRAPATKVRHQSTARSGRMRTYKDPVDRANEQVTQVYMRRGYRGAPLEGALALVCWFHLPDRRWKDSDNLLKHVMDAGNRILWKDDHQIRLHMVEMIQPSPTPMTVIRFGPSTSFQILLTDSLEV